MYSTPNSSSALAISIFLAVSKKAVANCSPSRCRGQKDSGWKGYTKVDSMIEKFDTRERKSSALERTGQLKLRWGYIIWIIAWDESRVRHMCVAI